MYRTQTLLILLALLGLFAWVGHLAFGLAGAVFVLAAGIAVNVFSAGGAARMILWMHRARPISVSEAPGLHHLANSLAQAAGIPRPTLAVYPSDAPNAFAIALPRRPGVVAVSTSLARLLDRDELKGVLAHEFSHLKHRDSFLSLTAGLFVQTIATMSTFLGIALFLASFTGFVPDGADGLFTLLALAFAAPYAARALHAALMRTRERQADETAALLTGDPRSLASALVKLERYNRYLRGLARRFRFIYTSESDSGSSWLRTHPGTDERVRRLRLLDQAWIAHPAERPRMMQA